MKVFQEDCSKQTLRCAFQDKFDVVLVNENLINHLAEAQRLYDEFKNKP